MPSIIETTVYKFDELSESAKDAARNWWKDAARNDDWYDSTYDDAKHCGMLLGITVDKIHFSGFSSQGDGACFEGSYRYRKGAADAIAAYTGGCDTLVNIAAELEAAQAHANNALTATVKHKGRYYHEYCTDIDVERSDESEEIRNEDELEIVIALRRFMRWTYRELEKAYNDYMSNENVDENIRINEYTFTVSGERFG
jgi:hypothetical protein